MQHSTGRSFQSIFTFDCFPTHFLIYSVGELDGKGWFFFLLVKENMSAGTTHSTDTVYILAHWKRAADGRWKIYLFAHAEHQREHEDFLQRILHPGCITLAGDHLLSVLWVQQSPSVLPEVRCLNHPHVTSEHRIYDKDHFRLDCW